MHEQLGRSYVFSSWTLSDTRMGVHTNHPPYNSTHLLQMSSKHPEWASHALVESNLSWSPDIERSNLRTTHSRVHMGNWSHTPLSVWQLWSVLVLTWMDLLGVDADQHARDFDWKIPSPRHTTMRQWLWQALSADPQGQPKTTMSVQGPVDQWLVSSKFCSVQLSFTWETAVEADCIAWRLWKHEQAAQKGYGKGKGQPVVDAPPQTFEV